MASASALKRFFWLARLTREKFRSLGPREATRRGLLRLLQGGHGPDPLQSSTKQFWLRADAAKIRADQKQRYRTGLAAINQEQVEKSYPLTFEHEGRLLRYCYLPAQGQSQGLVVQFHAFDATNHFAPVKAWRNYDMLAPWDTFGFRRQGSWFWGEKGDPFVARMIGALIKERIDSRTGQPWFCFGGSMGGFGALWHGLALKCDGLYIQCPQIDIDAKIREYSRQGEQNPYGHLADEDGRNAPDLFSLAQKQLDLPPLFLVQHQYDSVNPFADHAYKLIDIYNKKGGWLSLRVLPAIGHYSDGSQEEAEAFFDLLRDRGLPRTFKIQGQP